MLVPGSGRVGVPSITKGRVENHLVTKNAIHRHIDAMNQEPNIIGTKETKKELTWV